MARNITNGASPPGTNGHSSYSSQPGSAVSLPVTSIIAEWVASSSKDPALYLTEDMHSKISDLLLDFIGITVAAAHSSASTPAIVSAITSLSAGSKGSCTVLTKGSDYPPHIASLLNATFGHSLDFDDTHAAGTLHPGVTTIAAALAQSEATPTSTDTFLLSLAVGYEITCRLGTELGYTAYSRGFHNTSTAGIFGAIATIAVLKGLSSSVVENAFGLAGSRAAGSMQYLDNGSHNKRLHPGFACHDAFVCVALAEAGVVGATRILEGKMGFLNAYSPGEKDLNRLVSDLGSEWRFMETSLKPYPACRMTHGVIEMADQLARKRRKAGVADVAQLADEVKRIEIRLKSANMSLVGDRTDNKLHPKTEVDGQFSAYFQAAHSYLFGADQGVQAYARLGDPSVYALSEKIFCVKDENDPVLGGMGSRIGIEYADGGKEEMDRQFPLGEKEHPFTREQIVKKFSGCMVPVVGEERAGEVLEVVQGICGVGRGSGGVRELTGLVA